MFEEDSGMLTNYTNQLLQALQRVFGAQVGNHKRFFFKWTMFMCSSTHLFNYSKDASANIEKYPVSINLGLH